MGEERDAWRTFGEKSIYASYWVRLGLTRFRE
jgi:hypothetical protein